jgi:hypothetical protein
MPGLRKRSTNTGSVHQKGQTYPLTSCVLSDLDGTGGQLPDELAVPVVYQCGQIKGRTAVERCNGRISLKYSTKFFSLKIGEFSQ